MLERPEAVSHYKNADRSVRERFALQKCRPQLEARESACFTEGKRPRIQAPPGDPPLPPLRQHKNVRFAKSIVKHEEKSYVWTRPEKSSGGEGLRPPPKECSKHRTLTKVRSADY